MRGQKRTLLVWEKNYLARYGWDQAQIAQVEAGKYGEMPVEYLTGIANFAGLELAVYDQTSGDKTLIPRVETEFLVAQASKIINQFSEPIKIAELGTGCGAISLAIASQNPQIEIWASDVDHQTLNLAQKNYQKLSRPYSPSALAQTDSSSPPFLPPLNNQQTYSPPNHQRSANLATIHWLEGDLWSAFTPNQQFDLIIANLPYIPTTNRPQLPASVIDFEPEIALFGGTTGLELITKLLAQAPSHLTARGQIWLEVDDSHHPEQLDQKLLTGWQITVRPDAFGINRFWQITPHLVK